MNKKAIGWPYILAFILGLIFLVILIYIATVSNEAIVEIIHTLGGIFG